MGVPKFFRYISERYPCLSELVRTHQVPDFDNLYLDMNGIVHNCTHPDDSKVNSKITEEMMFLAIFRYIEYLFQVIKPRKLFFLAIDGVAPRAKMNQQRSRRFRSAKEMEMREKAALQKGEVIEEEYRFDSNCITPGTEFMVRLHKALQYFIQRQISTNESWQTCQVILSGHDTPGEGEHKIMDYIRYMKSQPHYDPDTTHCLYGLDADLIMLGCSTHEAHISLLREEVKFGKQNTKSNCVENTRFFLLHLGILREYLELEFSAIRDKVPFGFDMDKLVDDWILMSFLVGNDFVPHLPNLHIQNNALPILYKAYMDVLPQMGGYMNEDGILNLKRFQIFLERLEEEDRKLFKEHHGETRYMSDELATFDDMDDGADDELVAFVKASEEMMMDDILDGEITEETLFEKEFSMCRRDYYITKMHFPHDVENYQIALRHQVKAWISAIQWILHYYYRGVPSWSWYFPNHYAPYISDITDFLDFDLKFDLGTPFLPFQQLLGVLPPNSKDLLPVAYQPLMLDEKSELIEFFPDNFETDMNGKKQDWEALVLIPFIDEVRLLAAMGKCENLLKDTERQRNKHGPMSVYQYTETNMGPVDGILKLPAIPNSYCLCTNVSLNEIRVPMNRLVFGPPKGCLRDVHFPGFPTMKFLDYTGKLASLRIRVFEMASQNDTMEVTVHQKEELKVKNVQEVHKELMDKEIFVGWPHLSYAKVVGVSDDKTYLGVHPSLAEHEVKKYSSYVKDIKDHHMKRMGIQLGIVKILIHVNLVKSREYVLGNDGKLVLKTDWDNVNFVYPYQTIVANINVHNQENTRFRTVNEVYSKGAKVFLLSTKYYGCMGKVLDTSMLQTTKRIQITIDVFAEPNLKDVLRMHNQAKIAARNSYFNMYQACSQIGVSKHALNRITGSFYVFSGKRRQINERSADKVNIGLQMRMHKENKEVPGISKYMDNIWFLSEAAVDIICEFLDRFPTMCDCLAKPCNNLFEDDLCDDPDMTPGSYLREISKYVETLPHMKIRPRRAGTEYIDPGVAQAIEQAVDKVKEEVVFKTIKLQTKLHLLYLPRTTIKCPDPQTTFRLFDRVIVATQNLSIPIGTKGTIVSIFSESDENPLKYENKNVTTYMYEVMFDDEIPNGNSYFGTIGESKVQVVTEQSIINITYGRNLANNRTDKESPREDVVPETNTPAVIDGKKKFPTPPQIKGNAPTTQGNKTSIPATETPQDKVTKDMLNNLWNALKQNPSEKGLPGVPNVVAENSRPVVENNAVAIDFTESLRKCLKITPSTSTVVPEKIQQPSPAQLPPPPANWRIEAQIKHLGTSKPMDNKKPLRPQQVQPPPPPPQMMQGPPVAQGPGIIRPNRPPGLFGAPPPNQFGSVIPPRPYFQHPPMVQHPVNGGYPRMGPINGGGPMPGYHGPPFNNNMGPQGWPMRPPNQGYHNNINHNNNPNWQQQQFFQTHQPQHLPPQQHRMSGPQTLSSASGQGAFIPLQAARKISKLKSNNNNSNGATVKPESKKAEEKANSKVEKTSEEAASVSKVEKPKTDEAVVKKTPANKPKKDLTPKPARLAANFSIKE